MTDWSSLRHAYGPADDVPALLQAARLSDDVWDELWSRLCHQGTVYPASYAALPALASIAGARPPSGYSPPLQLVVSILASCDGPGGVEEARQRLPAELGALRELAERSLGLARGEAEFSYGLQALAALEGMAWWQQHLEAIADGELALDCARCGRPLLLMLEDLPVRLSAPGAEVDDTRVEPAGELEDSPRRLCSLARQHGYPDVAAKIELLAGVATCPVCREPFGICSEI